MRSATANDPYLFIHHILLANAVLGEILAHPRARDYADVIRQADELATLAVSLNAHLEFEDAAYVSKLAAKLLVDASDRLGFTNWRAAYQRSDERRPGMRRLLH